MLPKSWLKAKWVDVCSDANWQDYHGLWGKQIKPGNWVFIAFTNMLDACGRDAIDLGYIYLAEVYEINLANLNPDKLKQALSCIGNELKNIADISELEQAYAAYAFGLHELLDSYTSTTHPERLRSEAKKSAEEYIKNQTA